MYFTLTIFKLKVSRECHHPKDGTLTGFHCKHFLPKRFNIILVLAGHESCSYLLRKFYCAVKSDYTSIWSFTHIRKPCMCPQANFTDTQLQCSSSLLAITNNHDKERLVKLFCVMKLNTGTSRKLGNLCLFAHSSKQKLGIWCSLERPS